VQLDATPVAAVPIAGWVNGALPFVLMACGIARIRRATPAR